MRTKAIRVSKRAKIITLKEASRQSLKTGKTVTQGAVIEQFTEKLNKRYGFLK